MSAETQWMGYVLFSSAQMAMRAEAVLRREGFAFRLVPAPRQLSAECSTALSFNPQDMAAEQVEETLRAARVPFTAIHVLAGQDDRRKGGDSGSA